MSTVAGDPDWVNEIERADDGDDANGATFQAIDELADRTAHLQMNSQLAIVNHRIVKVNTSVDRYERACWGDGAGPFNQGLFMAVGKRSGGGAAIGLSPDGEQWFDYQFANIGGITVTQFRGVAHGGNGAFGSRVFAVCGFYVDGANNRPCILTAPDDAEVNADNYVPEISAAQFTGPGSWQGTSLLGSLRDIVWNGTVFCAVGDNGLIVTMSADLATATVRTPGSSYTDDFYRVFSSGSLLIACGENGEIQRSTDQGVTWTRVHTNVALGTIASGVPYLVGTNDGIVLRSTNAGVTWSSITLPFAAPFDGGKVTVFALGQIIGATLRDETNDGVSITFYSFDRGATWPVYCKGVSNFGTHIDGFAQNSMRAVLVGGHPDATTASHIFATGQVVASVS